MAECSLQDRPCKTSGLIHKRIKKGSDNGGSNTSMRIFFNMCEALESIPSTAKKKIKINIFILNEILYLNKQTYLKLNSLR